MATNATIKIINGGHKEMFAIARLLLGLVNKAHLLLANYKKEHPHFMLYMSADAIISCSLVFGGFQIAGAMTPPTLQSITAEHSGILAMSENQITEHLRFDHRDVYWLGPVSNWRYALNCLSHGLVSVTYLPHGQDDLKNIQSQKLTVQTYDNAAAVKAHAVFSNAFAVQLATDFRGDLVTYDPNNMRWARIQLQGKSQIVVMNYPQIQNASKLLQNANTLRLIQ